MNGPQSEVRSVAGQVVIVEKKLKSPVTSMALRLQAGNGSFQEKFMRTYINYVYGSGSFASSIEELRRKKKERYFSFKTADEQLVGLRMFQACVLNEGVGTFLQQTPFAWVNDEIRSIMMRLIDPFFRRYETIEETEAALEEACAAITEAARSE